MSNPSHRWQFFADFLEREALKPDLSRAIRSTCGFMVPLIVAAAGWTKWDPVHMCIAAQSVAMVDVRGAYSLRLGLLVSISIVFALAVVLGSLATGSFVVALAATAVVILAGGIWRHLSSDYGPGIAVASSLLFFVTMGSPPANMVNITISTLLGGFFGVLLQVLLWPFHPQHPVRRTAAESWNALGELLETMAENFTDSTDAVNHKEVELRATLNRTQASLHASKHRSGGFLRQIELLNIAAARLGMRVIGLRTALEVGAAKGESKSLVSLFLPLLNSLANASRTIALAVVSRQPDHWAAFEVRMKRLENLFAVARSQVSSQLEDRVMSAQLVNILQQIEDQLPTARKALKNTMTRVHERAAFSLELFDLNTLTLKPLAATLNFKRSIDPSLLRHTARATILCLISVALMKWIPMAHGYWLPFTILVVLQPDFGATREKAAQRVLGTVAGGLIASSLLWLHPPHAVLLIAIGITIALFGYFLKRNYGLAVVFITLMVVLLTEWHHPVTLAFTVERMSITLAGGLFALGAAWIFWPAWEKGRFPVIMTEALSGNLDLLKKIDHHLAEGIPYNDEMVQLLRTAESANAEVFGSLRRMSGDPKNRQQGLQEAAALANGNKRVTQALSVIALHLNRQQTRHPQELAHFEKICAAAFAGLISLEETGVMPAAMKEMLGELEAFRLPEIEASHLDESRFREPWIYPQLSRVCTELSAMIRIGGKL